MKSNNRIILPGVCRRKQLFPSVDPHRIWPFIFDRFCEHRKNELQWLIMHRAVKTAVKLYDRPVTGSPLCSFYGVDETLEHLFLFCHRSRKVWFWACNILNRYWKRIFDIHQVVFFLPFPPCKYNISSWFVKTVNYYIWIHRNLSIFENDHKSAHETITKIRLETYARIDANKYRSGKQICTIWGSFAALLKQMYRQ